MNNAIHTIGHSNRSLDDHIKLLKDAGVDYLIDVRRFPHSPRQPHFNIEALPGELAKAEIKYHHMAALGGRRPPRADGKASMHTLWREGGGFQSYADYAETPLFAIALKELMKIAETFHAAIMCAEADWRNCHRRIITDYLLINGVQVEHIMSRSIEAAQLTHGALIRTNRSLLYSDMPLFA
ncbi:MAG TPA: DUF488 domain-containing protein [Alphaproteobacteria bacterium]|nr:DUF488 domain-containing protein [Alphaproteobacteria bacterium]